ncbi:hypothetical protein ACFQ0T_07165 [Kitasatospora gansuensis]
MGGGIELVVIGADGGPERAHAGSARAAAGAQLLAAGLPGRCFDAGARGSRVTLVPPEADANAMLTALRAAAQRPARWLVVCLLGQLAVDPRGRGWHWSRPVPPRTTRTGAGWPGTGW